VSAVEDGHAVGHRLHLVHEMGRVEDRGAGLLDVIQNVFGETFPHDRVETRHRLVQQEQIGAVTQGQYQREQDLHPLGVAAHPLVKGKAAAFRQLRRQRAVPCGVNSGAKGENLAAPHPWPEILPLGHKADRILKAETALPGVLAQHRDAAGVRFEKAKEQPEQGRLSGSVAAKQRADRALGQLQPQVHQHLPAAVAGCYLFHPDGYHCLHQDDSFPW
jgi:hypothetical protein